MENIVAVFGGSFNPPINSHFQLAQSILDNYREIEKVIFIPVSSMYNKKGLIDNKHRYEMLKLGCQGQPNFEISDIELRSEKQLYTIETLDAIQKLYPDKFIYFIIGTDNLKEIETWYTSQELVDKYHFLVLQRNDDDFYEIIAKSEFLSENNESFIYLDKVEQIHLSSSMIREKIKNKEDITEFVPENVEKYIKKNKLYEGLAYGK